ncbi:MAG: SoxR reducing system RseC family protein [Paludibacter sp.]|jgi:sigma-E factor negative regulatory protein RseC|nr:SoxR reducing system RseC family protein [Paludibacter sp.]
MSQLIEHSGIVRNVNGKHIQVQIVQLSACSSCHAKGACSAADMDEKLIDVETDNLDYKVGDTVILYGQSSMGLFAVLLAFVIPFLLILLTLLIINNYTDNESLSGSIALGTLVPYFLILSRFNTKLKSRLKFQAKKLTA